MGDRGRTIANTELPEDMTDMSLDGPLVDLEFPGDFGVRTAGRKFDEDVVLPRSQTIDRYRWVRASGRDVNEWKRRLT